MSEQTRTGSGAGQARTGEGNQPFVGRNVIVGWGNTRQTTGGEIEERAAIITRVNADGTCQLHVFNPEGGGAQPLKANYADHLTINCWSPTMTGNMAQTTR